MSATPLPHVAVVLDAAELASFLAPDHFAFVGALRRSRASRAWMKGGLALMRAWRAERARLPAAPDAAEWEALLRTSRALLAWRRDLP